MIQHYICKHKITQLIFDTPEKSLMYYDLDDVCVGSFIRLTCNILFSVITLSFNALYKGMTLHLYKGITLHCNLGDAREQSAMYCLVLNCIFETLG